MEPCGWDASQVLFLTTEERAANVTRLDSYSVKTKFHYSDLMKNLFCVSGLLIVVSSKGRASYYIDDKIMRRQSHMHNDNEGPPGALQAVRWRDKNQFETDTTAAVQCLD